MNDIETALSDFEAPDLDAAVLDLDAEAEALPSVRKGKKTAVDHAGLRPDQLTVRIRRSRVAIYDWQNVKRAAAKIHTLPEPGEAIHAIVGGDHNGFDLLPAILDLAGAPARSVDLATLGFNQANAAALADLIRARQIGGPVRLLCSDYFAKVDAGSFDACRAALDSVGVKVLAARSHCKIILADCGPGRAYVVESSANLRTCNSLEQFALINDAGLFNFHRTWIDTLFATHEKTAQR
jgi:hypothetical protein